MIDGRWYRAHRLAFLYETGSWPESEVDHIDGDPGNNAWKNLRLATRRENCQNMGYYYNTSGRPGVTWNKHAKKWETRIRHGNNVKRLGYFDDLDEAAQAYRKAKSELHAFQPTPRFSAGTAS